MHKALTGLDLETLKKHLPEQLQAQSVTAVLLALGSNYQAENYLPRVRESLATLGEMYLSTAFENPDFTSTKTQPKPDYTNQCVYLSLKPVMTLQQLQQVFKQFERDCGRQRSSESTKNSIKPVTMDIDILMIKPALNENSLSKERVSEKQEKWPEQWIVMADRYPFKAHERAGIEELIANCVDYK